MCKTTELFRDAASIKTNKPKTSARKLAEIEVEDTTRRLAAAIYNKMHTVDKLRADLAKAKVRMDLLPKHNNRSFMMVTYAKMIDDVLDSNMIKGLGLSGALKELSDVEVKIDMEYLETLAQTRYRH